MKKFLLILLALVIALSFCFAGCKAAVEPEDDKPVADEPVGDEPVEDEPVEDEPVDDGSIYNELGTWPVVKDEYKGQYGFTALIAPGEEYYDYNAEDNMAVLYYEKLTNIDVYFEQINPEDKDEKINLMLAAGTDLPDVFMTGLGATRCALYGSQGLFIPLNDYVETIAPGIDFLVSNVPSAIKQMTFPDGNIYSLCYFNQCYHCNISMRYWINNTWLETLELDAPNTIDEFADTLRAFVNDDPNGNGEKDEIGVVCPTDFWNAKIDGFLVNPFVVCNQAGSGTRLYVDDDGKIQCSAAQEGWKDAMKWLRDLYAEGLIDHDCFSTTTDTCRPLTQSDNGNRVGSAPGGYIGGFVDMETDLVYEYTYLLPLEGPAGRHIPMFYEDCVYEYAITNAAENPELCFRWGDMLNVYTKEQNEGLHDNEENGLGHSYRLGEPGEYGLDGRAASDGFRLTRTLLTWGEYNE